MALHLNIAESDGEDPDVMDWCTDAALPEKGRFMTVEEVNAHVAAINERVKEIIGRKAKREKPLINNTFVYKTKTIGIAFMMRQCRQDSCTFTVQPSCMRVCQKQQRTLRRREKRRELEKREMAWKAMHKESAPPQRMQDCRPQWKVERKPSPRDAPLCRGIPLTISNKNLHEGFERMVTKDLDTIVAEVFDTLEGEELQSQKACKQILTPKEDAELQRISKLTTKKLVNQDDTKPTLLDDKIRSLADAAERNRSADATFEERWDSDGKPLTKREAKERGRCKDTPVAMKDRRRLERILTGT